MTTRKDLDFVGRLFIVLIAATCFSYQDIKDARCDVACMRSGYDSGFEKNGKCQCFDSIESKSIIKKRLALPKGPIIKKEPEKWDSF